MSRNRRSTRRVVVTIACAALAAGALATSAAGATASPRHPLSIGSDSPSASTAAHRASALGMTGTVHYAVDTPTCAKPTAPDFYTCFAYRRRTVSKSTKGAFAYTSPEAATTGPDGGYTPADLASAYGYNPRTKVKQTIGIIDWYDDPTALSDLNTFDKHYHLPKETKTSFRKLNQKGGTRLPKRNADSAGEITLDIQSARAVCQTCRILLVEATSPSDANLAKAENEAVRLGATEVSNSFGSAEASHKIKSATVQAYNHPGVVITASSGDEGWYGWDYVNKNVAPQNSAIFPATSPTVVSVGGTELGINSKGRRGAEIVWNEDAQGGSGATGGGCSRLFKAPAWQKANVNYKGAYCRGGRLSSDVSAIADPQLGFDVYQTYGGPGWETIGGTSLSSPVTAAMWALVGGAHNAAYPGSALYVNAQVHPSSVYDVRALDPQDFATGNSLCQGETPTDCYADAGGNPNSAKALYDCSLPRNGSAPTASTPLSRECNVTKGLDGPTGLGTPKSLRLFTATTPTLTLSGPAQVRPGKRGSFKAKGKEIVPGTKIKGYQFFWGDGSRSTSRSGRVSHTYKKAGKHILTVVVTDSRFQETFKQYRVTIKK